MNTKKVGYFLVFLMFFSLASTVYGASDDTRYFIKSSSGFWKKSFNARNDFKDGFTADLSDWQIKVAHVFGVEVVPVIKLNVLDESKDDSSMTGSIIDKVDTSKGKPSPSVSPSSSPSPSVNPSPSPAPQRPLPANQIPWGVKAIYAGNPLVKKTSGGAGVNVAVLDTGILISHPDLKDRVVQCKDFTSPKMAIVNNQCDDKNGHGTHVAGIIAADGGADGRGIYGIAPEASISAYKVCGVNGSCWSDDIANAIRTAADNGVNVINLSLGSDTESQLISEAIKYAVSKHVLVVAAAGNDGPYIGSIDYPAANAEVVAVGAFDPDRIVPEWSSRGINSTDKPYVVENRDVEFAAPGVNIESTWKDGSYVILSGTSMATPHVAGLAAKLWQTDDINPDSATRILLQKDFSEDILPPGDDDSSGFGFPHI